MSRRSSRLASGGYYNSDEESDSSTVTNISYRENPVKVFKKKPGGRKSGSRTPSRTPGHARSEITNTTIAEDHYDALSPSSSSGQSQVTMRTVPYTTTATAPTPRPALTPSTRSQTPVRCPSVPSETGLRSVHCGSSSRAGLHFRPSHTEPGQSGVDSSGYSSSEGAYRKPGPVATRVGAAGGAHGAGYRSRIIGAFDRLMASATSVTAAAHSKLLHVTALAANASLSARMKKACGLVLLLLLALLCVWLLLPFLASFISRLTTTKISSVSSSSSSSLPPSSESSSIASSSSASSSSSSAASSQMKPLSPPVVPATPSPQPSVVFSTPVVDSAVVSAAVDAKLEPILVELQLKQERLLAQIRQKLQGDMQDMKAKLEAASSGSWQQLDQEVSGLSRRMAGYQTDSQSAATNLDLRIQKLEAQNVQLSQELSTVQLTPPPAPCPEPPVAPVANQLTPELQQAMERWFTDRVKEQDAIRLAEKGGCSDCGRPLADKMPDFALETQGASVVSTRCSETYRIRSACVTLFGFPLWYPSESPRTVIQGYPVLLPGKCWAFHGVQGTLVISLSHPVRITHVTLDHLPRYNSPTGRIDSAPKDFEVYGMKNDTEEGTLLGTFTYDENGESTQTFELLNPSDAIYRLVELRVLTNWGHVEYTCLYRFRVHGKMEST